MGSKGMTIPKPMRLTRMVRKMTRSGRLMRAWVGSWPSRNSPRGEVRPGKPARKPPSGVDAGAGRLAHDVVALVDVQGGSGDAAGERAHQEGRHVGHFLGGERLADRRVHAAIFDDLVDDADGARRAGRQRAGGD